MENVREELDRLIRQRHVGYSAVSRLLNRNPAYIQQFIKRGSPRKLDDEDRRLLARFFGVDEQLLGGPPPRVRDGLVEIPVLDVDASAGFGAIAESEAHGFVKILTAKGSDRILGATIIGQNAGEILAEVTFAMKHKMGLRKILQTIHPYPTWAEANKYAAGQFGLARKPEALLKWAERWFRWQRS